MMGYLARRLAAIIPVLFGISLVTFSLIHFIPGDPVRIMLGRGATAEMMANARHQLNLDQPLYTQYFLWLWNLLHGDLGRSYGMDKPVTDLILSHFLITLRLAVFGVIISVLIAVPTGILSATKKDSAVDYLSRVISSIGISLPPFFTGIILILVFALDLRWFPSMGVAPELFSLDGLKTLLLPAFTIGFYTSTVISRMLRATMLEVMEQDYVRTARSKGLSERAVIYGHALKNALIPVVTVIGTNLGYLLGGTVIVETVFAWPGLGFLMVTAVLKRDYPLVQGIMLFFALVFTLANLGVDMIYSFLDPRIRHR
jgi:peptide/nickel transport system permease protein